MRLMNNASHILSICNLFQPFHFTCVLIIWEKKTGKSSNCGGSLEKNVVNGISFHFIAPSWAQSDGVVFATCARAPPPPCFRFGWIIMRFFSEYKSMVLLEKLFLKAKYHKRKHRAKKKRFIPTKWSLRFVCVYCFRDGCKKKVQPNAQCILAM